MRLPCTMSLESAAPTSRLRAGISDHRRPLGTVDTARVVAVGLSDNPEIDSLPQSCP